MMGSAVLAHGPRSAGHARSPWDLPLLLTVLALTLLGIVMVYSASITTSARATGNGAHFLFRHLVAVGGGLALAWIVAQSRAQWWERAGPYLLFVGLLLLMAVLVPGVGARVNGSARWLPLGIVNLQPSELMKLVMVVYVAGYLVRRQDELRSFTKGILMVSIVVAIVGMLLLQEPDLGSAVVICLTVLGMLFLGGVRFWHFAVVVGAGIGGMVLLTLMAPYRMARITGFLDPWADPFNTGFQLTQALIAFGRGEWFGVGLGASVQKLFYLPAAHTDFLVAVIAEELGLFAMLALIAAFAFIVYRAFAIAAAAERAGNLYSARLAYGLGLLLGFQAIINLGVNMGVLPTKGLTLPFVSYGGSSMIGNSIAVGLLLMIARESAPSNRNTYMPALRRHA